MQLLPDLHYVRTLCMTQSVAQLGVCQTTTTSQARLLMCMMAPGGSLLL